MSAENYLMDIKQSDRRIGELVRLQTMMAGTPAPNEQIARDRAALEEKHGSLTNLYLSIYGGKEEEKHVEAAQV